jgi:hypothetical protein
MKNKYSQKNAFRFLCLIALILPVWSTVFGQVSVGVSKPDPSAQLEVSSTEKGALFPRMTESQRKAINDPANGKDWFLVLFFELGGMGTFGGYK